MAMVAGAGDHRRDNDRLAYDWRLPFGLGTESSHDSLCWGEMDSNFQYRGTIALDFRSIPGIAGSAGLWRGMDSRFQYAEAVKLVVAPFSCARCLGWVGVLRFSSFFHERQTIRRSPTPTTSTA